MTHINGCYTLFFDDDIPLVSSCSLIQILSLSTHTHSHTHTDSFSHIIMKPVMTEPILNRCMQPSIQVLSSWSSVSLSIDQGTLSRQVTQSTTKESWWKTCALCYVPRLLKINWILKRENERKGRRALAHKAKCRKRGREWGTQAGGEEQERGWSSERGCLYGLFTSPCLVVD